MKDINIKQTIIDFYSTLQKAGLNSKHTSTDDKKITYLKKKFDLPENYLFFLKKFNPKNIDIDPSPFQSMEIYSAENIDEGQEGYSTDPETTKPLKDWDKNWIVIAYDAGDPIFFDIKKTKPYGECPIYTAVHGQGTWKPLYVANSFLIFLQILTKWIEYTHIKKYYETDNGQFTAEGKREFENEIAKIDTIATACGYWVQPETEQQYSSSSESEAPTIFNTEIGMFGVWDSNKLSPIDSRKKWQQIIAKGKSLVDLINKGIGVFWKTGGDGNYSISVRINPNSDLESGENELVTSKSLNNKLVITSQKVCIGSPEWAGIAEKKGFEKGQLRVLNDLQPGTYTINIYFLYSKVNLDKNSFVVVIKSVSDNHQFPPITKVPQLG